MQVGGIGSGLEGHGSSHQVTNCIHDHDVSTKKQGGMPASSANAQSVREAAGGKEEMSLLNMLRDAFSVGRRFLGWVWGSETGGNGSAVDGKGGEQTTAAGEQVMAQIAAPDKAEKASLNMAQSNPYFTPAEVSAKAQHNIFRKASLRIQSVAKQMTKRFGGRFLGHSSLDSSHGSLDSKKRGPKEDLRKYSRYRENDMEIDCVLTDDSYLMDSYDRRGEYSKLTTDTGVKKQ